MKLKSILYIIIGVIALFCPVLVFKGVTEEYGNSTEPVLIGFRLLFILGGLVLIATGVGNIAELNEKESQQNTLNNFSQNP